MQAIQHKNSDDLRIHLCAHHVATISCVPRFTEQGALDNLSEISDVLRHERPLTSLNRYKMYNYICWGFLPRVESCYVVYKFHWNSTWSNFWWRHKAGPFLCKNSVLPAAGVRGSKNIAPESGQVRLGLNFMKCPLISTKLRRKCILPVVMYLNLSIHLKMPN